MAAATAIKRALPQLNFLRDHDLIFDDFNCDFLFRSHLFTIYYNYRYHKPIVFQMEQVLPASWIFPITNAIQQVYTLGPYVEPTVVLGKCPKKGSDRRQ